MPDFTDWAPYVAFTSGDPPRPLHQAALACFTEPGTAVDLGCGAGNETLDLLDRGWQVHAVDSSAAALAEVSRRARSGRRLTLERSDLWDARPPVADLVYAGFSLFFAPPERFAETWAVVTRAVRPGGMFAGQLLGVRDDWAQQPEISAQDDAEVQGLLEGWAVERLDEVEYDGRAMSGPKHWHLYEVLARRV
ncbi:class I SAM-dependent methyltransferase [Kribbella sp. NBC_00889]|uniref:class I SAM-dependent methyltransferase n=1 Tax=Kribbella sp. NBC_00889 TaxID=2975974 RepID=UPI00386F5929|nr:class I SAM-dependent methyltransferase [Kribbella sp. NBC_00889]